MEATEQYSKATDRFITAFLCRIGALTTALDQPRATVDHALVTTRDQIRRLTSVHVRDSDTSLANLLSLYRLDFKLNNVSRLGSFLLKPTDHCREGRIYSPVSTHTADSEILQLARFWVKRCNGHQHPNCRGWDCSRGGNSFLPARLIELPIIKCGNMGGITSTAHMAIRLVETKSVSRETLASSLYVTLSHCWGTAKFTRLLKENRAKFLEGIPFDTLPRSFRDAISLAARLDNSRVRYIWIDSLCIIQDDPEDWLRESVQMFQIYANSYCNISATAAKDGTAGLFFRRDPQELWENEVNVNTDGLLQENMARTPTNLPRGYTPLIRRCEVLDLTWWDRFVEKSPVNRRAWVLQERLLSPRVLSFCHNQIAWECPEHDATESFPDGVSRLGLADGRVEERVRLKRLLSYQQAGTDFDQQTICDPEQTSEMAHDHWRLVVERYSTTSLSHGSDKLIALAGIAQSMGTRIRGKYVAGMWEKYLASQLAWRVKTVYENGRLLHPSRRSKVYRAPTFSWASVDAPQGVQFGETRLEKDLWISVQGFEARTQTESPFGPLQKPNDPNDTSDVCFVDIDCLLAPVQIELHDYGGNCIFWKHPQPETPKSGHHRRPENDGNMLGSANADEVQHRNDCKQSCLRREVPFDARDGCNVQARAGAERDGEDLKRSNTTSTGTIRTDDFQRHFTHQPTSFSPQHRELRSKPTTGIYMDCPEDDRRALESPRAESYCLPVSRNPAGDLICLLVQRQEMVQAASAKDLYRRVGLLTFPAFLPNDQKVFLEQAGKCQAQIRLV